MSIGRRLGGAPRWLIVYVCVCVAALLFAATILYLSTVHAAVALRHLVREGATPRPVHDIPYAPLINRIATGHHLNPALVAAVVAAESGFNPQARSPRGAYGLMQVMPATWREGPGTPACPPNVARLTDPPCMDDPGANLEAGTAYLARLVDRFKGNLPYALAAYNAGAGTVEHHEGVPPFPETTRYVRQVALAWYHLQRDGTLGPFWRQLIRSRDLERYARIGIGSSLVALLTLLFLAPPMSLGRRRQGIHP